MEPQLGKEVMPNPRWTHDRKFVKNFSGVVGVDEAGRGCLAGPVVAGCVILPKKFFTEAKNRKRVEKINDSKQFDESTREKLFEVIHCLMEEGEMFGATGSASVLEIEEHNIVGATCLAMQRAMEQASVNSRSMWKPTRNQPADLFASGEQENTGWQVLVDGRPMKRLCFVHDGLVKGDTISLAVAMASLLAKVTRDREMRELGDVFPAYGFSSNKGYGAPVHIDALRQYGPCDHHRPRFLRNLMNETGREELHTFEQTQLSLI